MNDALLISLMRLFALMVSINREELYILARNFIESFISQQYGKKHTLRYLEFLETEMKVLEFELREKKLPENELFTSRTQEICREIMEDLHITQRYMILLTILRFTSSFSEGTMVGSKVSRMMSEAVRTVAEYLMISEEEYQNCEVFIADKFYNIPRKEDLLIVSDDPAFIKGEIRHLQKDNFKGQIFVLRIPRADIYLYQYAGKARLESGGRNIFPRHIYIFPRGGSIRSEGISPLYFSEIVSSYISVEEAHQVDYLVKDLQYHFRNSKNGIQPFNFQGRSGQFIAIIGGSGTGKSTLINLLNGSLKPQKGGIYINGNNLHRKGSELDGIIGYIPQDDLLHEELTVYQNLYFNGKLCLDGHTSGEIEDLVKSLLMDLDLYDVRNLKVGSPLNKFISGGQRKRLNIALELLREPHILFVDEPTSGLSSTDSENVVTLLKEQTLKGKLVFTTIHQPSSDLFKQFDHLLVLDKGGYLVYSGNPMEGIKYFKTLAGRVDASESACGTCGTANPDEILKVIEARDVDEYGSFTKKRKTSPKEWHRHYLEKIETRREFKTEKSWIPYFRFLAPGRLSQFRIFFIRNLLSKLADKQYLFIALLIAPVLALVVGFFSKYVSGDETDSYKYVFSQNENLPAYLFMSVVVALFLGLIMAAEEIIRDRKILERESFLHLKRQSYLSSKILMIFLISAIQILIVVLVGNLVMEIRGMGLRYWLILFSTACFANLLGLNISDGLKSVVAIYIVVPFLLVPQILLAGIIVKFDRLHYRFDSQYSVPVTGDLMASRWAYEALAVTQFKDNKYQAPLNDVEQLHSNVIYDLQFLIPALRQELDDAEVLLSRDHDPKEISAALELIRSGFSSIWLTNPYSRLDDFSPESFSTALIQDARSWLDKYHSALDKQKRRLTTELDSMVDSLRIAAGGHEAYLDFRRNYDNEQLNKLVLNRSSLHKIVQKEGKFVRKMDPIYMMPVQKNGRAHQYSPVKKIGNISISTFGFNIGILWIMSIVLYLALRYSILRKAIEYFAEQQNK